MILLQEIFYKGGEQNDTIFKKDLQEGSSLALVMAMTYLVFSNVASVSAADDASDCVAMGSYRSKIQL